MIFGMFGKKPADQGGGEDHDEDEEIELVSFQGALNGKSADLQANAKLAQIGLIPAKEFVTDALSRRAEMVRIDIKGERAQSTLSVDGVVYAGSRMPRPQAVAITQIMKLLAGLDPKNKATTQQGGLKSDYEGHPWEISVETTPQAEGVERLTLRFRDLKAKLNTLDELGFPGIVRQKIREKTPNRKGLVIIAGPPGSGVTTTTFAAIRGIDMYMYSCMSVANLGSREIINCTKFESQEGDSIVQTIARVQRAEADVLFVDPIKDAEYAKTLVDNCDTLTLMAEMPAKDAASAVAQLCAWVGDPAKVADAVQLVISSKLIRQLCEECKEAFRPNPKLLAKVGLPPETKVLYKKGEAPVDEKTGQEGEPCGKCGGIGYYGRVAMLEMLEGTEEMKEVIKQSPTADAIKAQMRKEGMQTLQKDGLRLVVEGKTALEELQRTFSSGTPQ